jgi:hypothetical protein
MKFPGRDAHDPNCQQNWEFLAKRLFNGKGSPETVVAAKIGSLYLREDGGAATTLYVKESNDGGNTGWIAK